MIGSNALRQDTNLKGMYAMGKPELLEHKTWPQDAGLVPGLLSAIGATVLPTASVVLMEFETHSVAAPLRFDAAVKAGSVEDTAISFIDFASHDFALYTAFHQVVPSATAEQIIVPRADLRANPVGWLPYLLYWLAPADTALAELPETAQRLNAWQNANPAPDQTLFRHHDAAIFKHLEAANLDRLDVEAVFQDVLGRAPSIKGALALQTQPSLGHLREALLASPEYLNQNKATVATPHASTPVNQPDGFPGFAAAFDRPENLLAVTPSTNVATARAKAEAATAPVIAAQQSYQPFYGLGNPQKSNREALLRASCDLLTREFAHVQRKSQIRILDVGCNAGFASFVLAETFPNTIGFDVNSNNIALCKALKAHSGSPAMFFEADLLKIAEKSAAEFEALDAVLFLNVIHQLIFAKGIPYVKSMLGQLSRHVDLIVVELSRPAEYIPFGKDHLLPLDPAEILEECRDATITLVKDGKRPVYTIRRRALAVDGLSVPYNTVNYSLHDKARVNRKYYFGSDSFTKVIRYTALQSRDKLKSELHGLRILAGQNVAPAIRSWDDDGVTAGRVVLERLYGPMLGDKLSDLTPPNKRAVLREVIRIGAALAENKLCQNDFSTHNFIYISDGSLRLVDFELAGARFLRDPFALFLWIANDVMVGTQDFYKKCKPESLTLAKPAVSGRVDQKNYPPLRPEQLDATYGEVLAGIIQDAAQTRLPWSEFILQANKRILSQ